MANAIQIETFQKSYGTVEAVNDVSLAIREGELFGLIGPDGAGKTTLMRSVCTLLKPDAGSIRVLGKDVVAERAAIRATLGYMPQRFSLYQDLSVAQNLRFFADLFQVSGEERAVRLEELYQFSRLKPFQDRKAGALSGGMKQKLALMCALVHTPEVLVLDEPTFGVDPVSRMEFWDILREIREAGTTILVSTAYMEEADQCDRVGLMHRAHVRSVGTPDEVKKTYAYPLYRVHGEDVRVLRGFLDGLEEVRSTQLFGDAVHVSFREEPTGAEWKGWQEKAGQDLEGWEPQAPGIEDVFMELAEEVE
ncbi:MAG: ABC transporter ATP-binding protein [bacterium]|nr:ABC transporter ATP-binding protein [bacterium]